MKKPNRVRIFIAVFALILLPSLIVANEGEESTVVFTPFFNLSDDKNYDYLSIILPNAFTSAFSKTGHSVTNASESSKIISQKFQTLDNFMSDANNMRLAAYTFNADYIISGSFVPEESSIKIKINIYNKFSSEILTFNIEGPIESKMFSLVDTLKNTISKIVKADYQYKSAPIPKGSRICVFSNLRGAPYNDMLISMLNSGMNVASVYASEISPYDMDYQMLFFRSLSSKKGGIERSFDGIDIKATYEPWLNSNVSLRRLEDAKKIRYFYMEDKSINEKALEDLSRVYGGLDYIFFINVNSDDKKYWLRCYDTGKKEFIWMESAPVADDNPELSCAQTAWSITGKFPIQTK